MLVKVVEYASIRGVTAQSLRGWINKGMPTNDDGMIETRDAIEWEVRHVAGDSPATARTRKDNAQAEKTEMEVNRLKGVLVPISEVEKEVVDMVLTAKAKLLNLPNKIAVTAMACTSIKECEMEVRNKVEDVLEELTFETYQNTQEKTKKSVSTSVEKAPDPFS